MEAVVAAEQREGQFLRGERSAGLQVDVDRSRRRNKALKMGLNLREANPGGIGQLREHGDGESHRQQFRNLIVS